MIYNGRLASFPTRRSSDLCSTAAGRTSCVHHSFHQLALFEMQRPLGAFGGARIVRHKKGQRSEEHTSELQSLAYLVYRLLLEKKKKPYVHSTLKEFRGLRSRSGSLIV